MAPGGAVSVNLARSAPSTRPPGESWIRAAAPFIQETVRISVTTGLAQGASTGRHIAYGIPGQKCRDLIVHLLQYGHSGHLRPGHDCLQGIMFQLRLHWPLGVTAQAYAAQATGVCFALNRQ